MQWLQTSHPKSLIQKFCQGLTGMFGGIISCILGNRPYSSLRHFPEVCNQSGSSPSLWQALIASHTPMEMVWDYVLNTLKKMHFFFWSYLYYCTLIKGMHTWFTASCNDKQQTSQLVKLGIVGQEHWEKAKVNQHTHYRTETHAHISNNVTGAATKALVTIAGKN